MLNAATMLGLYAVWLALTARAQFEAREFGSERVARLVQRLGAFVFTRLLGLSLSLVGDEGGPPKLPAGPCVGAFSPHSAFPVTQVGLGLARFRIEPALRACRLRSAAASLLFWVPVLREWILLFGARNAGKRSLVRCLEAGCSVGINPGGNYEMASASSTHEAIYCQGRLGFVRLAMAAGAPIVPLYAFGENQLFVTSSFGLAARRWLARKLRVGVPLMAGRFGVPFGLPLPTHVTVVVGRPIDTGAPNANPTAAEVDVVFGRYVDEIARLWARNARRYLPPSVAANGFRIERIGSGLVRHVSAL